MQITYTKVPPIEYEQLTCLYSMQKDLCLLLVFGENQSREDSPVELPYLIKCANLHLLSCCCGFIHDCITLSQE